MTPPPPLADATFREFIDQMPDAVAVLDGNARILYVNEEAQRLLGRGADEIIGRTYSEVCPDTVTKVLRNRKDPSKQLIQDFLETRYFTSGRWYETALTKLPNGLAVSVTRDVTDRKRAVEVRDHLMGILGHEIRNPLAAIALSLDVLETAPLDEVRRKAARRIANCVRSLRRLTSDLLDVARTRGGALPIERAAADLRAIASAQIEELSYLGRNIELHVRGDVTGFWDGERLAQALTNLLLNAVQYSAPESDIAVELAGDRERVRADVVNFGERIAPRLLARLFEPFERGSARSEGVGLGLHVVRLIAEAHGGAVSVDSTAQATRFRIELPRFAHGAVLAGESMASGG